jgi:pilus assembly protein CpaE
VEPRTYGAAAELTALLVAPDRQLADQFTRTLPATRAFQVLADLKAYPSEQALDMRMRQFQPEVVLLDLATNFEVAASLIRFLAAVRPEVRVVGLHTANDSEAILRSLRLGATEFLAAPFDPEVQRQAVSRIRRLLGPQRPAEREPGRVALFSSAKPGSGASVLAVQTALSLRCVTGESVLLADLDGMAGTAAFYLKLPESGTGSQTVPAPSGIDVLAASGAPGPEAAGSAGLHEFLERSRQLYSWIVLDLPAIFHKRSLAALAEADVAFLVSTPELPSLHLARKAAKMLGQLGFGAERFQFLINRAGRGGELGAPDLQRIVGSPLGEIFPEDAPGLARAIALGEPLEEGCELARRIRNFAGRLAGVAAGERKAPAGVVNAWPAFSAT